MKIKNEPKHYCLTIFAQDKWKSEYSSELISEVKSQFFQLGGHSDCDTCCTCPICKALEDLFDPNNPGQYDLVCDICKEFLTYFKNKLGQSNGIILFSHYRPIKQDLIDIIFQKKTVKKVYVLNYKLKKPYRISDVDITKLESKIIGNSRFPNFEN